MRIAAAAWTARRAGAGCVFEDETACRACGFGICVCRVCAGAGLGCGCQRRSKI